MSDYDDEMDARGEDHRLREGGRFTGPEIRIGCEDAQRVLWWFTLPGGIPPGDFYQKLLAAFGHADVVNRAALSAGFPELGLAFELVLSGRAEGLQRIVAESRGVEVGSLG